MTKVYSLALLSLLLIATARAQESDLDAVLEAPLSGQFASQINVTGGPWLATEPGQMLAMTFVADGLAGVKQFDLVVRIEPPAAFDISSTRFVTETPFLNPVPGGAEVLSEVEVKMGAAILGTAVDGQKVLGTLTMQTSAQYSLTEPARLVIQSFSIGPTSFERDNYDEGELKLGIVVSHAPTAVGLRSWGSTKVGREY